MTVARLLLALALVASVAVVPAVAQDTTVGGNSSSTTTTANATATTAANTTTAQAHVAQSNVTVQMTDTLKIANWRYEDGKFHITVVSVGATARVKVTDSGAIVAALREGDGAQSVSVDDHEQGYNLQPGRTTLHVAAETVDGEAAVTVSAGDSTEILKTGQMGGGSGPWSATSPGAGWFGGGATALAMVGAAAWRVATRERAPVMDLRQ